MPDHPLAQNLGVCTATLLLGSSKGSRQHLYSSRTWLAQVGLSDYVVLLAPGFGSSVKISLTIGLYSGLEAI